ncbi:hypothetical protein [Streptomyces hyaluromycini]|uniref:hypothetical protein n=1 Tax=Streptomyces hyaluromycini TaxID=1377993 RepID=UPI000B5C51B4|nr:hypothetical protein [Streptomyces hyaluromycini]
MTIQSLGGQGARLLPWSEDGKWCLLKTDDPNGLISRLADGLEEEQLGSGEAVLKAARKVLDNPLSTHAEVRYALLRATESLTSVLRIAESRGMRLEDVDEVAV